MPKDQAPLRLHFVGLKGIPATYGGVERVVEEVGARLAARGHHVVVHCRTHYTPAGIGEHRGMELRREPSIRTAHLDTVSHAALAMMSAVRERPDFIGLHNYPNGVLASIGRLARVPVVLHLHGFEWELDRWSPLDRGILRLMLRPALAACTAVLTVSRAQADYLMARTGKPVEHIPNGVEPPAWISERGADPAFLEALGLRTGSYVLYVGRLTPQKGVQHLIRGHRSAGLDIPLVLVGGSEQDPAFIAQLRAEAEGDPRVRFLGSVYGDDLWRLYAGCGVFVLPSDVEAMPMVLLEAMAARCPVLASRLPAVQEVGGDAVEYFRPGDPGDLRRGLEELWRDPDRRRGLAERAAVRAVTHYRWDRIAERYEEFYVRLREGWSRPA